jgi:hypothetical protein
MARIRSVHPGLFTDEAFMSASPHARVFMIGLWCEADDNGVFEDKPIVLKARLLPADAVNASALIDELVQLNVVLRFQVEGRPYGAIRNFRKWQRPQKPQAKHPTTPEVLAWIGAASDQSRTGTVPVAYQSDTDTGIVEQRKEEGGRREDVGGIKSIDNIYVLDTATSASERPSSPPFPSDGSISFGVWGEIAREERPGVDPDLLAQAFRSYAGNLKPPLSLQSSNIEARFRRFCTTHNFNFKRGAR